MAEANPLIVVARPISSGPRTRRRIGISQTQARIARAAARTRPTVPKVQAPVIGSQTRAQVIAGVKAAGKSERSAVRVFSASSALAGGYAIVDSLAQLGFDVGKPWAVNRIALATNRRQRRGPTSRRRAVAGSAVALPQQPAIPKPGPLTLPKSATRVPDRLMEVRPVSQRRTVPASAPRAAQAPKAVPATVPAALPSLSPVSIGAQAFLRSFLGNLTPQQERALGLSPTIRGSVSPVANIGPVPQEALNREKCPQPRKRKQCVRRGPPERKTITVRPCLQSK